MARNTQSTTKKQTTKAEVSDQPKAEEVKSTEETAEAKSSKPATKSASTTTKTATSANASKTTATEAKSAASTKMPTVKASTAAASKTTETEVKETPIRTTTATAKTTVAAKKEIVSNPAEKTASTDTKVTEQKEAKEDTKEGAPATSEEVKVKAVPEGYSSVTPSLIVRGAAAAIDYYTKVFGAKELSRIYAADGYTIANASIMIGDAVLHLCDEMPTIGMLSSVSMGAATSALQVYSEDIDVVWTRAVTEASYVLLPLEDVYWGERTGKLVDPFGQVWILSQKTEDLTAEEIQKRYLTFIGAPADVAEPPVDENAPDVDIAKAINKEAGISTVANMSVAH